MASIDDLADLIAQHRATLERAFESEMTKLRLVYGDRHPYASALTGRTELSFDTRVVEVTPVKTRKSQARRQIYH